MKGRVWSKSGCLAHLAASSTEQPSRHVSQSWRTTRNLGPTFDISCDYTPVRRTSQISILHVDTTLLLDYVRISVVGHISISLTRHCSPYLLSQDVPRISLVLPPTKLRQRRPWLQSLHTQGRSDQKIWLEYLQTVLPREESGYWILEGKIISLWDGGVEAEK